MVLNFQILSNRATLGDKASSRAGWLAILVLVAQPVVAMAQQGDVKPSGPWVSLFNGKDLDGWIPKLKGHDLGDNDKQTFRVQDGVIRVAYDQYKEFGDEFGHLFYKEPFSNYRLRVEYRFVGDQCKGGAGWALRNSGAMIHCQDPKSMRKDQDFPVSIEVQYLGGLGQGERPTANLCTPGTNVVYEGKLHTQHCTNSKSKTINGDEWVTVEVEVHGNGKIRHFVDGQLVLEYEQPQLDETDADAKKLIAERGGEKQLSGGYISLQAESHPVEFRKVEIQKLEP